MGMLRKMTPLLIAPLIAALPAQANDLPPGLQSARLLPGWTTPEGTRMAALELVLEPGWKTYWRSPGDTGLPPRFDWDGSSNLGQITFRWPAPEAIDSDGAVTLGYHDRLVLPFEVVPEQAGAPVELTAAVEFGLCENVCVPAHLTLTAPPPGNAPDPAIKAALARVPEPVTNRPACRLHEIGDGMQVSVELPEGATEIAALELAGADDVWVSATEITDGWASADFVGPTGKPFPLNPADVVVTLIGANGATESRGCIGG